jgi:hypothetical protein
VNVYGIRYRLLGDYKKFTRNGVSKSAPFTEENKKVQVYARSKNIVLTTDFGLTVMFDEKHRQTVTLCDAYADSVCGLCGNADGKQRGFVWFIFSWCFSGVAKYFFGFFVRLLVILPQNSDRVIFTDMK